MMSMVLATGSVLPAYANILTDEVIEINKEIQEEVKENDNKEEIIKEDERETEETEENKNIEIDDNILEEDKKIDEEVNDEIEIRGMSDYSLTALDQDIINNPDKYFDVLGSKITGFKMGAFTTNKIKDIKTLTIPSKIGSKQIDTISEVAFWVSDGNEDNIINAKVIIPDSIIKIDDFAFYENQIEELEMGNNVQFIGECAFFKNNIQNKLIIPDSVTEMKNNAFFGNQI